MKEKIGNDKLKWNGGIFERSPLILLAFALVASFICLFPTLQNGFVNWDDSAYILRNSMVWGLSWENLQQMFTTSETLGLYHPLTLFSFAVDYTIWGTQAFGFHLTNLLLHLLNIGMVFGLVLKLTKKEMAAFVAALLFGMHPMHLESVAWISGRKDVLYTVFALISLLCYLSYAEAGKVKKEKLVLSFLFFCFALLAKAMAFTLPFFLLLIDYLHREKPKAHLFLEKLPFFVLTLVSVFVAISGQQASESMVGVTEIPITHSIFIGFFNSLLYLFKSIIPISLSPFHPFPFRGTIELPWWYYASILPFTVGLYFLGKQWQKERTWVFGLAFFLISIGPVLQIIPFGKAIHAERYTYFAYIGVFYLMGIGVEYIYSNTAVVWKTYRLILLGVIGVWFVGLGALTFQNASIWKNSDTLWSAVIERYPEHDLAYNFRGMYLVDQKEHLRAMDDLNTCIELNPGNADCYYERGRLKEMQQQHPGAFEDYSSALELNPTLHRALLNRAMIRAKIGKDLPAALLDLHAAVEVNPDYALGFLNLGFIYELEKQNQLAVENYSKALELEPWNAVFWRYRGVFYYAQSELVLAKADFTQAINLDPTYANVWYLRSKVLRDLGQLAEAKQDAEEARVLGYSFPEGYLESLK